MSRREPKHLTMRKHAKRRAMERFGLSLTTKDLKNVVKKIQNLQAEFIQRESLRVSRWRLTLLGQCCDVLYDRDRKEIITFLYPTDEKPYQRGDDR